MIKKTLQAFALLTPLTLAHAESSVSMYGILDLSVGVEHTGSGVQNTKALDSGAGYGSRLGFKGVEDLGGGLNANFLMEMGIAADTGTLQQGGSIFGRQIFAGLSAPKWSVSAGRQYSPLWVSLLYSDAYAWTYWGNTQGTMMQSVTPTSVAGDGGFGALSRINNSVLVSGVQGPWTARLMAAAGDEAASSAPNSGSGRLVNGSLTYASGPFGATASLVRFRQYAKDIPAGAMAAWQNAWEVGGQYDFGPVKLFTGYYHYNPSESNITLRPTTALKTHAYWLGGQIPFGQSKILAQVMSSRFDRMAGIEKGKATTVGVTYEYALSKRSFLYSSYGQVTNNATSSLALYGGTTSISPRVAGDDPRALSFGMRHHF